MAKIIHVFKEKSKRRKKIQSLMTEGVENTVPLIVLKSFVLISGIIVTVLCFTVGIFSDPLINKIFAVLTVVGVAIFYFVLGLLYLFEKKTGKLSRILKK